MGPMAYKPGLFLAWQVKIICHPSARFSNNLDLRSLSMPLYGKGNISPLLKYPPV